VKLPANYHVKLVVEAINPAPGQAPSSTTILLRHARIMLAEGKGLMESKKRGGCLMLTYDSVELVKDNPDDKPRP